jgi:hypothetical protein
METENIKQQETTDLAVKEYKPNLLNALKSGNKPEINLSLKQYKHQNGVVKFDALFEIPSTNRLPALPIDEILPVLTAGLTLAFETMNLVRGVSDNQLIDLAETILETSSEDNLALEDVMLFLQKLTRGEYGKLYESMDIPKFMEFFEKYREERWQALKELRYEQSVQHKALPVSDRILTLRDFLSINKNNE